MSRIYLICKWKINGSIFAGSTTDLNWLHQGKLQVLTIFSISRARVIVKFRGSVEEKIARNRRQMFSRKNISPGIILAHMPALLVFKMSQNGTETSNIWSKENMHFGSQRLWQTYADMVALKDIPAPTHKYTRGAYLTAYKSISPYQI